MLFDYANSLGSARRLGKFKTEKGEAESNSLLEVCHGLVNRKDHETVISIHTLLQCRAHNDEHMSALEIYKARSSWLTWY